MAAAPGAEAGPGVGARALGLLPGEEAAGSLPLEEAGGGGEWGGRGTDPAVQGSAAPAGRWGRTADSRRENPRRRWGKWPRGAAARGRDLPVQREAEKSRDKKNETR